MTDKTDDGKRGRGSRPPGGPRGDRPRGVRPSGDRPPRRDGDKPFRPRAPRPEGAEGEPRREFKPRGAFKPREDRSFGDRPPRRDGDKPFRPRAPRPEGAEGEPRREFKPRGSFKPRDDRPSGERPPRRDGDKPFRPRAPRPEGAEGEPRREFKPRGAFKPRDDRPFGERPPRRDGDKPFRPRAPRPEGGEGEPRREFKPRGAFKPRDDRPFGERPPRRDAEPRAAAPAGRPAPEAERIAKVMARAGLCSRRDAEEWITSGRVSVNGVVIESPALDVTRADRILVDGVALPEKERTRLWLFHKPKGLVTTEHDPEGRPTVFDNLPEGLPRVVSVGRLDINTEGLLLLTNDGGLARVLAHPTTAWLRRYRVRVHGAIEQAMLDPLQDGITIVDPELGPIDYAPIVAKLERTRGDNSWLSMDLREGKNREIKRVLEHLGLQVTRLIRVSFGPFQLGDMPEGTAEEVRGRMLKDQLGERLAEEAGVDFEAPRFEHGAQDRADPDIRPQRRNWEASADSPRPQRSAPAKRDLRKPGAKRDSALLGESDHLKVEREKVADRKGRSIKVERIVTLPREEDRPRAFRPRSDKPFGDRPPRRDGDRPFTPRGDRPEGETGERNFKPRRAFTPRDGDSERPRAFTPRGDKPFGDRPPRRDGDRPFTPRGDRPEGETGERNFKPRRAFTPRDGDGERPRTFTPRGDKPFGDRPPRRDGDRPFKPRGDRPAGEAGARAFKPRTDFTPRDGDGERPRTFKPRFDKREGGDARPTRGRSDFKPRGDKPGGSGDRPRPGGSRPGGPKRPGGGKGADRRR